MATALNVENDVTRQDTFKLHPDDILLGRNSRCIAAADQDETDRERALSIAKHGQLVPALGHRDADKRVVLDEGFGRLRAIRLLRKGFEAVDDDGEKRFFQDPDAELWVAVDTKIKTDEEAFVKSALANQQRKNTTDVQEALAQQVLREEFGWSDTRIARQYGYTNSNRVMYLKKLLTLPDKIVQKVHRGELALYAALDLLKVEDPAERDRVIEVAAVDVPAGGKIDGSKIREEIRRVAHEEPTEPVGPEPAREPSFKRTVKEFKRFAAEVQDEATVAPEGVKKLFGYLCEWFAGERQDKSLWNTINELKDKR